MAKPQKCAGGWRMQIQVGGKRLSGTFATQREANAWAAAQKLEHGEKRRGAAGDRKTLADALKRYSAEESPKRKGDNWEQVRMQAMLKHPDFPITIPLNDLLPRHFAAWKESRLRTVKPSTFNRDMNLLNTVFVTCQKDWDWCKDNPLELVRRPPNPPHRERVITRSEIRMILRKLDHRPGRRPDSMKAITASVFLVALHTGMRAGEIVGLRWDRVHETWLRLPETKNGTARDVPIPMKARRIFRLARGLDTERPFPIQPRTLDTLFRRARDLSGLHGFTFHDSRHTAATRIGATVGQPGRLSFPEFCVMFGWKDPKHALIYVNPSAAALAEKL